MKIFKIKYKFDEIIEGNIIPLFCSIIKENKKTFDFLFKFVNKISIHQEIEDYTIRIEIYKGR